MKKLTALTYLSLSFVLCGLVQPSFAEEAEAKTTPPLQFSEEELKPLQTNGVVDINVHQVMRATFKDGKIVQVDDLTPTIATHLSLDEKHKDDNLDQHKEKIAYALANHPKTATLFRNPFELVNENVGKVWNFAKRNPIAAPLALIATPSTILASFIMSPFVKK